MQKTKLRVLGFSLAIIIFCGNLVACSNSIGKTSEIYKRTEVITSSKEAKQLLVDGNKRYVSGKVLTKDITDTRRKMLASEGQHPFVVVVCCSDSRVPPELIFLEKVKAAGAKATELYAKTEDENIKTSVAAIEKSIVIKHLKEEGKVTVIGAKYHIETGEVIFND